MTGFYAALATAVVALTLLTGALSHATRPSALGDALRAHGTLPPRAVVSAAVAVPVAEGALGVGCCVAAAAGARTWAALALALSGVLFALYAGYARHVTASGRGGPCGCSRAELPMSAWVTRRAAALAVLAAAGAAFTAADPPGLSGAQTATALLAGSACAVLLWALPAAMHQPAPAHPPVHRPRTPQAAPPQPSEGAAPPWTSRPAR